MKVSVIGRSTAAGSFVSHIANAFRELGHEASTHDMRMLGEPRRGRLANVANIARRDIVSRSPRAIQLLYRSMLSDLAAAKPDLIVTTRGQVSREEVEGWRNAAAPARIVLWFPDHLANFGRQQAFAAGLDRIYVKDPYVVDRLQALGGIQELRYLAEGAPSEASDWATVHPVGDRASTVAMVGNIHPTRVRFLEALLDEVPVDIYGRLHNDGVPDVIAKNFTGKFLSGEEKYRTFRDARGVLNNLHYAEVGSVNYRLFEAAACRGVILTDDLPQVCRYLEPDVEVITFKSAHGLAKQLGELSNADFDRIGTAAHTRVVKEHLIRHRVEEMLHDLALK